MKILAIIGSPRKGNTYQVLKQVEEKMQKYGNVEFTYLFLKDTNLKTCIGCFQCVQKGPEFCSLNDDSKMILDKMLNSDGIVLASPAYNYNITSLMKNFIDRFAYNGHRPQFFKQHIMIVATTGGIGLNEVKTYLTEYVAKLWGFRSITNLGLVTAPYQKSDNQINRDNKKISKITKIFFYRIQSQNWSPKYYHIDQFCTMRALWSLEGMKDAFPADYKLYKSLWKQKYYFDIKINYFKYVIAYIKNQLLILLIKTTIKKPK